MTVRVGGPDIGNGQILDLTATQLGTAHALAMGGTPNVGRGFGKRPILIAASRIVQGRCWRHGNKPPCAEGCDD